MMSRRLAWLGFGCALFACGDDAPVDDDAGSSSSSSETGSSGSIDDTSGTASSDGTGTGSTDASSGALTTSGVDGPSDSDGSSTAGTTTDGSSSDGSTGEGSTDTTGGGGLCEPLPPPGDWPCNDDGDCEIAGDCCGCIAFNPNMGAPGNCGGGCGQDVCEQLGLDTAVCIDNTCQVAGFSCNQDTVVCDEEPPECDDGMLPQVLDGCFTEQCIPVEHCDWVPDCDTCPIQQICVVVQTDGCDQFDCVDPFPECGGAQDCDCLGEVVCPRTHPACEVEDGAIVCS